MWIWAAAATVVVALCIAGYVMRRPLEHAIERMVGARTSDMHVEVSRREYPVKGIDISHHNGHIDFRKVAADSVEFVMIKATEGVDLVDSCMARNYDGAVDAGLKAGFYHFFRFDRGGVRQGRHFLSVTTGRPVAMPLVIDVETAGNPYTDYYLVVGRLRDMIGYLRRHGKRVMLYCNTKTYDTYIRGNFEGTDLWIASQREADATGDDRNLWQHSHKGHVDGISTAVDINTFNGTRAQFAHWLAKGTAEADSTAATQ